MPINHLIISPYALTAYNPNTIPDQPVAKVTRDDGFSERLPWGNTEPVIPAHLMAGTDLIELAKREKNYQKLQSLTGLYDEAFNHIEMRPASFTKMATFWMYAYSLGKGLSFIMPLIVILSYGFLYLSFKNEFTAYEVFQENLIIFITQLGVPIAIWVISSLYFKLFGFKKGQGAKWSLNRQTGMVTLYQLQNEKGQQQRIVIEKPFFEFDAYLMTLPNCQGFAYYTLYLQHRYQQQLLIKDLLDNEVGNKQEAYAMWCFLQNYMDTSQPLPEFGDLEFFRAYDPTTFEYDQHTGRNPRYWRDMPYELWQSKCADMAQQVFKLRLNSYDNIMAKHVRY